MAIQNQGLSSEKSTIIPSTGSRSTSTIFSSILSSKLPPEEKRKGRLAQEGFVIVVAGGETTARVLTAATFHLLANKHNVLPKLREELLLAMPDQGARPNVKTLEQLPWLVSVNPFRAIETHPRARIFWKNLTSLVFDRAHV